VSEELTGTGTPTQAYQGTSKKSSEEEGETDLLLSAPIRLLVRFKYYSALSDFAAPSASLAPSSPLAGSSTAHGLSSTGENSHLDGGLTCNTLWRLERRRRTSRESGGSGRCSPSGVSYIQYLTWYW
jgi:hypothetical protein